MIWEDEAEIWPGDRVWYTPGNQREQAEIVSLDGSTQARIRILTGPETGREIVAPWGIISLVDRPWRRYDPDDIRTHPEDFRRVEVHYSNWRNFPGTYSRGFVEIDGRGHLSLEMQQMKSRWRYQVPPDDNGGRQ